MRIGVDMDGVCSNWTKGAREMINQRFGLTLDIFKESDYWDEVEDLVTPKQWKWLWTAGVERGLFARLDVVPGTYGALSHLSDKHDIIILTHRPKASAQDTFWWVSYHLKGVNVQGINLTKDKGSIPCDIYLDDKPENITALAENRPAATPVIRTRKYNEQFEWPFRVDNWEQFVRFVEEREDK